MSELRKDYVLDRWVVISSSRGKRPREFKKPDTIKEPKTDFFARGNEHLTPEEIGRFERDGKWQVRWFENKFPAVEHAALFSCEEHPFVNCSGFGYHEIVVETPHSTRQLADLSLKDVVLVVDAYKLRIKELGAKHGVAYVNVFKNHGPLGGTSIVHSHSQIITTPIIPPFVEEKERAGGRFLECPYGRIIEQEREGPRFCFENKSFVAFAPFASRYNFEVWLHPKDALMSWDDVDSYDLADILKRVLRKLERLNASYNFALFYSPNERFRVHLEVYPDIAIWGGFERGSGIVINSVAPEYAAQFYRGEIE